MFNLIQSMRESETVYTVVNISLC